MAEALTQPDALKSEAFDRDRATSKGIDGGFYVDIEAGHPIEDSGTLGFYQRGWRGVNVISDPDKFHLFAEFRADDININAVVGVVSEAGGTEPRQDLRSTVPRLSLSDVLDRYGPNDGRISFLKISAGAHTASILNASNLDRHRPEVIVLDLHESKEEWVDGDLTLTELGYRLAFFDVRRRIYCRVGRDRGLPGLVDESRSDMSGTGGRARRLLSVRGVEARLEALGYDAEEARAELQEARLELVQARGAAAHADSSIARMHEELEALRATAGAAEARMRVLSVELTRTLEAAARAQRREEILETELAAQEGLRHLSSSEERLSSEEVAEILAAHHSAVLHHRNAHDELALWRESVRASTSWKLTRPIRVVGRYMKRVYRAGRR